jgi:hypothetical protein
MLEDLKEQVCQANLDLVAQGLVTLTWGNVSGRSDDGQHVVIKASGVAYSKMRPADMVVVDLSGNVVEGSLRPQRYSQPMCCCISRSLKSAESRTRTADLRQCLRKLEWRFRVSDSAQHGHSLLASGEAVCAALPSKTPREVPVALLEYSR